MRGGGFGHKSRPAGLARDPASLAFAYSGFQIPLIYKSKCAEGDLNPHVLADTSPSSWPVFRFQHPRINYFSSVVKIFSS